jgi:hypothetical protein
MFTGSCGNPLREFQRVDTQGCVQLRRLRRLNVLEFEGLIFLYQTPDGIGKKKERPSVTVFPEAIHNFFHRMGAVAGKLTEIWMKPWWGGGNLLNLKAQKPLGPWFLCLCAQCVAGLAAGAAAGLGASVLACGGGAGMPDFRL